MQGFSLRAFIGHSLDRREICCFSFEFEHCMPQTADHLENIWHVEDVRTLRVRTDRENTIGQSDEYPPPLEGVKKEDILLCQMNNRVYDFDGELQEFEHLSWGKCVFVFSLRSLEFPGSRTIYSQREGRCSYRKRDDVLTGMFSRGYY